MKSWIPRIALVILIAVGFAAIKLAPRLGEPPQQVEVRDFATRVKVISIPKLKVQTQVTGFGRVAAAQVWSAVAEVAGQVSWISPELKDGLIVAAGTELLRIDDSSYRLALAQIEAQLRTAEVRVRTTQATLKIKQREQRLLQQELKRQQTLLAKGSVSRSGLEQVERQVISGEGAVLALQNTIEITHAESDVLQIQRQQAQQELSRTVLTAPFDLRITQVSVDELQYINRGQTLFSGDGTEAVEIEARFPIGQLRPLFGKQSRPDTALASAPIWKPGAEGLQAEVKLQSSTHSIQWDAQVARVSGSIDPVTQTLGIVVRVENPYAQAETGVRPPLVRNMYVEVTLKGRAHPALVIPASALHEGKLLYIVNDESRLELRPVQQRYQQKDFVVLAKGVNEGEQLITSDLIPAVEGMLLEPMQDKRILAQLKMSASGGNLQAGTGKGQGKGQGVNDGGVEQ